jgi:adenylate cyclase
MSFAIPVNESGLLEALRRYQILDTATEVAYDEITELAAQICGCPVAVIRFVDEAQDWKKIDIRSPGQLHWPTGAGPPAESPREGIPPTSRS